MCRVSGRSTGRILSKYDYNLPGLVRLPQVSGVVRRVFSPVPASQLSTDILIVSTHALQISGDRQIAHALGALILIVNRPGLNCLSTTRKAVFS